MSAGGASATTCGALVRRAVGDPLCEVGWFVGARLSCLRGARWRSHPCVVAIQHFDCGAGDPRGCALSAPLASALVGSICSSSIFSLPSGGARWLASPASLCARSAIHAFSLPGSAGGPAPPARRLRFPTQSQAPVLRLRFRARGRAGAHDAGGGASRAGRAGFHAPSARRTTVTWPASSPCSVRLSLFPAAPHSAPSAGGVQVADPSESSAK